MGTCMQRIIKSSIIMAVLLIGIKLPVLAGNEKLQVVGQSYELNIEENYEIPQKTVKANLANSLYIQGNVKESLPKDGISGWDALGDDIKFCLHEEFFKEAYSVDDKNKWHIVTDDAKQVEDTKLNTKIGTGAIVIQTRKNMQERWKTVDIKTNIMKTADIWELLYSPAKKQLENGCYYRIIIAYRMERKDESQKFIQSMFHPQEKKCMEIYELYMHTPLVDGEKAFVADKENYKFDEVRRVDNEDGFANPKPLDSDDPHVQFNVGTFYVSGYTDCQSGENNVPVFLKKPGDNVALWFDFEQSLNICNNDAGIRIENTPCGSDRDFGTGNINNFGHGAVIIRKIIPGKDREDIIYTNYLEATVSSDAITKIDLFEEGDYEVVFDYQIHYDKPFVFQSAMPKVLSYQISFAFNVRNGDISMFLRDAETDEFLENIEFAPNGFYVDFANAKYQKIDVRREKLNNGIYGFDSDDDIFRSREGEKYTDEGIYTITVTNLTTGSNIEKTVYVISEYLYRVHINTGKSITELYPLCGLIEHEVFMQEGYGKEVNCMANGESDNI